MVDYQKMYYTLFHAAEDAISVLATPPYTSEEISIRAKAIDKLIAAQQKCEELYIAGEE